MPYEWCGGVVRADAPQDAKPERYVVTGEALPVYRAHAALEGER